MRNVSVRALLSSQQCVHTHNLLSSEPPYFVTQPADTQVVVGNHFILRCEAASHEGHTHTRWLVDGQEVGGARREVLGDGSLLVVKTELSDSGDYTCSASNQHGEMNATAHVRILSKCHSTESTDCIQRGLCKLGAYTSQFWSSNCMEISLKLFTDC